VEHRLTDLLDIPRLQSALDSLYVSSRIPSAIIDNEGVVHAGAGWQEICTHFHRVNARTLPQCVESDLYITSHIREANPSVTYRCPRGLVDTATPIIIEGHHIGNVFTGQLFLAPPDREFFRQQAREFGFDDAAYLAAMEKVPVITEDVLQQHLAFITHLTSLFAEMGLKRLREREAEQLIRESAERHRAILRTAMEGYWLVGIDGRLLEVNETYCRMSGYGEQELLTMTIPQLEANETPEVTSAHMAEIVREGEDRFESRHRRKDGTVFDVEVSVQYRDTDDGRLVVFVRDISERKRTESEKRGLESQLAQAQKMESVGRLAGGIAHDFNNMLSVILGHAEMALAQIDASNPLHADLLEMHKAATRSADLTRQLLTFARKQDVMPRVLDLNATVADSIKMLQRLIGEDITLRWQGGEALWPVSVDPSQVHQILANLCVNARDAIEGVGTLTIATANVVSDVELCALHADAVPGDFVCLTVADDGHGMTPAVVRHIFDPFFTTKAAGKGTGLGLATVYGAVKQNGGFVTVHSVVGVGTRFEVYLPRHVGAAADDDPARRVAPAARGRETILLVEDEPALLSLTSRMLSAQGYAVLEASGPPAALQLATEHLGRIDLLLTDIVMPDMSGRDLAETLRRLRPGLKCLFMSGFSANRLAGISRFDGEQQFIAKPFSLVALAEKVRAVLDAR
jgi:PAS domain S-box-containing protein